MKQDKQDKQTQPQPQGTVHVINGIALNLRDVPGNFLYCFCDGCPQAQDCLRYRIGQLLPPEKTEARCVLPQSYQAHDTCRHYRSAQPVRLAWGMKDMFADVLERDGSLLRQRLYRYFGCKATYSRYENGRFKLTPKMQREVLQIFADMGYDTENRRFLHYEDALDLAETRLQDLIAEQKERMARAKELKAPSKETESLTQ